MKLLLDACVWGGARGELIAAGHDVDWAGDWPQDPGDEKIMDRAAQEGRVLVTLDKNFGELAIVRGKVHCGIVRLVNISARQQPPFASKCWIGMERSLGRAPSPPPSQVA